MAINKITYADKTDISTSTVPIQNKVTGADMTEVKSIVNTNADLQGDLTELETSVKTSLVDASNEILEKLNLSKISISSLWKNSSPTSNFTNQTITLSSNNYDYLIFLYYNISVTTYTHRGLSSVIVPKGESAILTSLFYNPTGSITVYCMRRATYQSATSYVFGGGVYNSSDQPGSGRTDNQWIIPSEILGIKIGE